MAMATVDPNDRSQYTIQAVLSESHVVGYRFNATHHERYYTCTELSDNTIQHGQQPNTFVVFTRGYGQRRIVKYSNMLSFMRSGPMSFPIHQLFINPNVIIKEIPIPLPHDVFSKHYVIYKAIVTNGDQTIYPTGFHANTEYYFDKSAPNSAVERHFGSVYIGCFNPYIYAGTYSDGRTVLSRGRTF